MGHVTRCLTLASELRNRKADIRFAMSRGGQAGVKAVKEAGFPISLTETDDPRVGLDSKDLAATVEAANDACILIDHYAAGQSYLEQLAARELRVLVIDDLADRDLRSAALILNQNLSATEMDYGSNPGQIRLLGPRFALLRAQFSEARPLSKEMGRHVLVSLGGGGVAQETRMVLEELLNVPTPLNIKIAGTESTELGRFDPGMHQVQALGRVREMAPWMQWADISINAGGSTCWELCCLGVPMMIFVLAANQEPNAKALEAAGCAINMGPLNENGPSIATSVDELLATPERLKTMSAIGRKLVDGRGAARVAKTIHSLL